MDILKPGMLVEIIAAMPHLSHLIGERFVLTQRAIWVEPAWLTPFKHRGQEIYAEDRAIKPVRDGDFERFMERVMKQVDLGEPVRALQPE